MIGVRDWEWPVFHSVDMATFTNQSKNSSTFKNVLRRGTETILNDISDFTFTDVIFADGTQLKDITFEELVAQVWANVAKSSAPTWSNQSEN